MQHRRFGNTAFNVSIIGLGCYGMSGVYGASDDNESIATIRHALDLGVNFIDTSANYGAGHNHRLIGQAIRGRRQEVVIHSKSGTPPEHAADVARGGGDPDYLRRVCETSLKNLGIETLDVFCMSRVDPNVPVEESVGAMAELVREGKTKYIALSEASAESLRRGNAVHPLASLQMEYSMFSRDVEEYGQIAACKELNMAFMAYAVLGRGLLTAHVPKPAQMAGGDIRAELPRFQAGNIERNLELRTKLEVIARRKKITLAQLAIAWSIAQGARAGTFIVPVVGAKSRVHLDENVAAVNAWLSPEELDEIDGLVPFGASAGTRYPADKMHRVNV
jgi:aryl-alcohol dehydrogenase-like predicted oxidoreductase